MIEHGYWGPISPNYVGLVHHLQVAALQEVVGDKYHPNEVFCSPVTTVKRAMIITQMSFLFNFFASSNWLQGGYSSKSAGDTPRKSSCDPSFHQHRS